MEILINLESFLKNLSETKKRIVHYALDVTFQETQREVVNYASSIESLDKYEGCMFEKSIEAIKEIADYGVKKFIELYNKKTIFDYLGKRKKDVRDRYANEAGIAMKIVLSTDLLIEYIQEKSEKLDKDLSTEQRIDAFKDYLFEFANKLDCLEMIDPMLNRFKYDLF